MIPANSDSDGCISRFKSAEAGVPGCEVKFLLVSWAVGNVGLSIKPYLGAVCVDDYDGVEVNVTALYNKVMANDYTTT